MKSKSVPKFKILAIGDQHFQTTNTTEVDSFISKLKEYLEKTTVDLIVLLGDLCHYHERLHTSCLNKAVYFVDILREYAPVYILVGNHDMLHPQIFLDENGHWLNVFKKTENVTVCDVVKGFVMPFTNKKLLFCPYVFPGRFVEALNTFKGIDSKGSEWGWKDSKIIFAHQEFMGSKMGAIISEIGDVWDKHNPLVVSGHLHDKQIPQKNIRYTGSCMQHAFGESHDKSLCLITFNSKSVSSSEMNFEEIFLDLPKKKILYKDVKDVYDLKIDVPKTDKVKLSLTGTYEEFKTFKKSKKYKELKSQGLCVVYKAKKLEEIILEPTTDVYTNFNTVLKDLIDKESNSSLKDAYRLIFEMESNV